MFRFTIRDVLWLTVVVALAVALWIEHRQAATARQERDKAHLYGCAISLRNPEVAWAARGNET